MSKWVWAHGKRIEVEELEPTASAAPATKYPRYSRMSDTWAEVLGKARASNSTWATAHVLLREARVLVARGFKPIVTLTNKMLVRVHVGERGKRSALAALERLGLVSVERRPDKNPIVTVYFFD